jgi:predicted ATP-binding protein involved in virulence
MDAVWEHAMRIDSIRLENFDCFEDRTFSLASRFTLIVGDNAKGKTSLLDGLAVGAGSLFLGFPSPAVPRGIFRDEVRWKFYHHGETLTAERQFPAIVACRGAVSEERGAWQRELTSSEGRTTRQYAEWIRAVADRLRAEVEAGEPVVLPVVSYYGTGRLWLQIRQREVETRGPQSRFLGYLDCLNPALDQKRLLEWFKKQEIAAIQKGEPSRTLDACREAILRCVPDGRRVYFDVSQDELVLEFAQQSLRLSDLSDGYRNMLAMTADIAVRCATLNPALAAKAVLATPGIVLIDEIDLHLHPKWQRQVVSDLLTTFPCMQFVATTHSPFVIQSLRASNDVKLLNLDNEAANDFVNKSVEDISEEVQGVELPQRSKRFIEMMDVAKRYYALLNDAQQAPPDKLENLRRELDELSTPFSDDPAYQAFLQMQRVAAGFGNGDS